jgi:hypothetical protein
MSKNKKSSNPYYYKQVAQSMGIKHLFGRWGISFYSKMPEGNRRWRIRFIPLDGWITDPKEVYKEMKKRDFEL